MLENQSKMTEILVKCDYNQELSSEWNWRGKEKKRGERVSK